jgi:hypothetical protein
MAQAVLPGALLFGEAFSFGEVKDLAAEPLYGLESQEGGQIDYFTQGEVAALMGMLGGSKEHSGPLAKGRGVTL